MNKIQVYKKNELLFDFESSIIPRVGEFIWTTVSVEDSESFKIESIVYEVDKNRKRMTITLLVI